MVTTDTVERGISEIEHTDKMDLIINGVLILQDLVCNLEAVATHASPLAAHKSRCGDIKDGLSFQDFRGGSLHTAMPENRT